MYTLTRLSKKYTIDEQLWKSIIQIAQFESEIELGGNPTDNAQAKVSLLTVKDFNYIEK